MSRKKDTEATRASLDLLSQISRELNTPLDLHALLERVIRLSMKNVGAINGSMIVLDESGQPVDSTIITGEIAHSDTTRQLDATLRNGLAGWVVRNKQAALIPDTSLDERWLRRPDDALDRSGPKSAVSAPILAHDEIVGVMTLVHPKPGFFTPDHLSLIETISDQAGIAVLNARLYAESQRQARVMTALANSSMAITSSLEVGEVLQRILEQTSQALRVEVASLALLDSQTQELVFRASTAHNPKSLANIRLSPGQGVAGWVAKEGRGVVVPDVKKDSRYYPEIDRLLGYEAHAIACTPIRARGQVIGVLEAVNPLDGAFDSDALLVLSGIGSLAGSALRHAQLFERLQSAHQRYRELFDDSIDPILITDLEGNILEANRQAEIITGKDRQELRCMQIDGLQVVNPQVIGTGYSNLPPSGTLTYETALPRGEGSPAPVQVHLRRIQIEGFSHLQWILRDITERKLLDTLRDDLLTMIYHDLRSPLSNIASSLDVLKTLLPHDNSSFDPLLNIAIHGIERIQRLTSALLDIRRLEAGQPIGNRDPIPVDSLIEEAVRVVGYTSEARKQELCVSVSPDLPPVLADQDMIRRVLINLLENASKYSSQGSKIHLTVRRDQDWVQFGVRDNGPGIVNVDQESIFDKYSRLQGKYGPKGLGLGLAFCRLAVEAHGGRIWVENEPDAGSHFKFTLPASELP